MIRSLFLIFAFCCGLPVNAETSVDELLREGISYQLQGDYDAAARVAEQLKRAAPDSAIGESLALNSLATQLSWYPDDTRYDEGIEKNAEIALALCEQNLELTPEDPGVHYRCGQANFAVSFLRGVRGRLITAGVHGTRAIKQFESALALDPEWVDPKMQLGMAYFYAENLPSFIKAIASLLWFVPKGDSDKSLPYLREVTRNGEYFRDVAKFVYADIAAQSDAIPPEEAERILLDMLERYPQNSRLHLARISLLMGLERPRDALDAANHALEVANLTPERELLARLWVVQSLIKLGEHEDAVASHGSLDEPGEYFPAWALPRYHLIEGHIADLSGDRNAAVTGYERALGAIGRYTSPEVRAMAQAGIRAPLFGD